MRFPYLEYAKELVDSHDSLRVKLDLGELARIQPSNLRLVLQRIRSRHQHIRINPMLQVLQPHVPAKNPFIPLPNSLRNASQEVAIPATRIFDANLAGCIPRV